MNIWFRRCLVILAIGGGFLGAIATANAVFAVEPSWYAYTTSALFIALYGYGIFVGIKVSEGHNAYGHLLFYFGLQVPFISSPFFLYRFSCGFHALVAITGAGLGWSFRLGSDWQVAILQPYPWGLGVNLFALIILFVLFIQTFEHREDASDSEAVPHSKEPPLYDYCSAVRSI